MRLPPYATQGQRIAARATQLGGWLVLAYLVAPILVVFPLSFTSGELLIYPLPGWSLRWYRDFFSNPLWTQALRNSVVVAVATTLLATAIGTLASLALNRMRGPWKGLILALLISPLTIPLVIVAVAFFYYFAWLDLTGTLAGLIIAHTVLALPFVVITVSATLKGFDLNLDRAAASLGAPPLLAFRRVTLPLIMPGVVSGALFAFVTSFDELLVVLFMAGPEQRTLPRQIYSGVSESISPTVTAAAVVLIVVSVALMLVTELLRRRGERLRRGA